MIIEISNYGKGDFAPAGWRRKMSNLKGKVAVVTGASKGIGAAIAKSLAAEGASVVVNYASSKEGAEKVVSEISAAKGKAITLHADVAKEADVRRLFEETIKAFGRVDILVNNAGIYRFHALHEISEDEFHRLFNTNVLGTLLATKEAAKYLGEGASIINISSIASDKGLATTTVYSATKGAVDSLTRTLANELAPKKIRVNAIRPGGVLTEGMHSAGFSGGEFEEYMIKDTPLGRLGRPDDIARVAVFLASDQSQWLTGQYLDASGGAR